MTTVVGLYSSLVDAQQTISELIDSGFDRRRVSFVMTSQRVVDTAGGDSAGVAVDDGQDRSIVCASGERRPVVVAGPLSGQASNPVGSEWIVGDALRDAGLGPFAVSGIIEAVCAGAILVAVSCEDRRVRVARDILDSSALSEIPTATALKQMFAYAETREALHS